jgi:hypothetical protein
VVRIIFRPGNIAAIGHLFSSAHNWDGIAKTGVDGGILEGVLDGMIAQDSNEGVSRR